MRHISLRLLMVAMTAASISTAAITSAPAVAAPTVHLGHIGPRKAPEFTYVPRTIKGKGFSTTPGETAVSFGGTPATSVSCASTTECTVVTPPLPEGEVAVTVTVEGVTSNAKSFTLTTYDPPVVNIVTKKGLAAFSKTSLKDHYPAIFTQGNLYLQIANTTAETQTLISPTLPEQTVGPGETAGYNFPFDEASPFVFVKVVGGTGVLTVTTSAPR